MSRTKPPSIIIGIDLGGTTLRVAALTLEGKVLEMQTCPIEARRGPQAGIERTIAQIQAVLRKVNPAAFLGIGIGSTGPVDTFKGIINNPYTLPGWENVSFTAPLSDFFGVPAVIENDADSAALGETWKGAAQGIRRLFTLTVGTGIGAAFIFDGKIYRGLGGAHGDGGHMGVDPSGPLCYCGAHGCLESLVSGGAIAAYARSLAGSNPTLMLDLAGGNLDDLDAPLVMEAARKGDPLALQVVERTARYIGLALSTIIHLLVPEMIVLSGGVMHNYDLLKGGIEAMIASHNVMVPATQVKIVPARLGDYAGVTGAACALLQHIEASKDKKGD